MCPGSPLRESGSVFPLQWFYMSVQMALRRRNIQNSSFIWIGDGIMVKLKVWRNILDIDENDLILDNGACYQIITK